MIRRMKNAVRVRRIRENTSCILRVLAGWRRIIVAFRFVAGWRWASFKIVAEMGTTASEYKDGDNYDLDFKTIS